MSACEFICRSCHTATIREYETANPLPKCETTIDTSVIGGDAPRVGEQKSCGSTLELVGESKDGLMTRKRTRELVELSKSRA